MLLVDHNRTAVNHARLAVQTSARTSDAAVPTLVEDDADPARTVTDVLGRRAVRTTVEHEDRL